MLKEAFPFGEVSALIFFQVIIEKIESTELTWRRVQIFPAAKTHIETKPSSSCTSYRIRCNSQPFQTSNCIYPNALSAQVVPCY